MTLLTPLLHVCYRRLWLPLMFLALALPAQAQAPVITAHPQPAH